MVLVQHDRLVSGLAVVLGAITVVMAVLGVISSLFFLFVALFFAVATYFVYYHASGRLAARVYQRVERRAATGTGNGRRQRRSDRGGFGAGPREGWTPPRDGDSARAASSGGQKHRRERGRQQRQRRRRQRVGESTTGPTTAEAYRRLDLDPGADDTAVKRAYREKVKQVHPDSQNGDEEAFKRVTAAYEQLSD